MVKARRVGPLLLVYDRGIVCCVERNQRDMDDPNVVEIANARANAPRNTS